MSAPGSVNDARCGGVGGGMGEGVRARELGLLALSPPGLSLSRSRSSECLSPKSLLKSNEDSRPPSLLDASDGARACSG